MKSDYEKWRKNHNLKEGSRLDIGYFGFNSITMSIIRRR